MLSSKSKATIGIPCQWLLFAALLLIVLLFSMPTFAADNTVKVVNAGDMLKRITDQIPALMRLVTAVGYVLGFIFIFNGIVKMKHLGESRTMMSQEHSISGPLIYLFVGAALIYLPSAVSVGTSTFWSQPNPIQYVSAAKTTSDTIIQSCFLAVQLFGTIAFIRGLVMVAHAAGGKGGHQGGVGKALTHMAGGIFCINIYGFIKMVLATIGVTISGFN